MKLQYAKEPCSTNRQERLEIPSQSKSGPNVFYNAIGLIFCTGKDLEKLDKPKVNSTS